MTLPIHFPPLNLATCVPRGGIPFATERHWIFNERGDAMLGLLRDKLPTSWHVYLFPVFNALRNSYDRLDRAIDKRTFTDAEFSALLRQIGFRPGAMVMVHSAFSLVKRRVPDTTPEKLI